MDTRDLITISFFVGVGVALGMFTGITVHQWVFGG